MQNLVTRERYFVKEGDLMALDKKKDAPKPIHYMLFNGAYPRASLSLSLSLSHGPLTDSYRVRV